MIGVYPAPHHTPTPFPRTYTVDVVVGCTDTDRAAQVKTASRKRGVGGIFHPIQLLHMEVGGGGREKGGGWGGGGEKRDFSSGWQAVRVLD